MSVVESVKAIEQNTELLRAMLIGDTIARNAVALFGSIVNGEMLLMMDIILTEDEAESLREVQNRIVDLMTELGVSAPERI